MWRRLSNAIAGLVVVGICCTAWAEASSQYPSRECRIGMLQYRPMGNPELGELRFGELPAGEMRDRVRDMVLQEAIILRTPGLLVLIRYNEEGIAVAKHLSHLDPDHPLHPGGGRVPPHEAADIKTLEKATRFRPVLISYIKGDTDMIDPEVLSVFDEYPPTSYSLAFDWGKARGIHRLSTKLTNALFLGKNPSAPTSPCPVIVYWPPEGRRDGPGDDLLWCGDYVDDRGLSIDKGTMHKISKGDRIQFGQYQLIIEEIDNDNDGDDLNNSVFFRFDGNNVPENVHPSVLGKPVALGEFLAFASWPSAIPTEKSFRLAAKDPTSVAQIEEQLRRFVKPDNPQRGRLCKQMLIEAGYASDSIEILDNGYRDSFDVLATKPGKVADYVLICAHYDKIGEGSQGIADNACGVVTVINVATWMKDKDTRLTYYFLLYGAHEVHRNSPGEFVRRRLAWPNAAVAADIRYMIETGGGRGPRTYRIFYCMPPGTTELRINDSVERYYYDRHGPSDNIDSVDYEQVAEAELAIRKAILAMEASIVDGETSPIIFKDAGDCEPSKID